MISLCGIGQQLLPIAPNLASAVVVVVIVFSFLYAPQTKTVFYILKGLKKLKEVTSENHGEFRTVCP